ncbi:MAG: DNA/RNA non-specific endonuclease [Deltaproteobacteria bacterium]|nr:DNA/RNA non-specific endonuclease [Deltaproteobacteria bacterium]
MARIIILFLFLFVPFMSWAFECNGHLEYGVPFIGDQMLCRDGYAVGYNYQAKQPYWVGSHIQTDTVQVKIKRSNHFHVDSQIPSEYQSTLKDYRKSGFDRGHLAETCARIDFGFESMEQSFLMSNMSPQLPGF